MLLSDLSISNTEIDGMLVFTSPNQRRVSELCKSVPNCSTLTLHCLSKNSTLIGAKKLRLTTSVLNGRGFSGIRIRILISWIAAANRPKLIINLSMFVTVSLSVKSNS